jgi:hypothetical protein
MAERIVAWVLLAVLGASLIWLAKLVLAEDSSVEQIVGLVGIVLAQAVAVLGLLVKNSVDRRSQELAVASERRLKVDSAIAAVSALQSEPSTFAAVRNGGVTLALIELEQIPMALSLVQMLWPQGLINPEAAIQVISAGIQEDDPETQASAAAILSDNASATFPEGGELYFFPRILNEEDWNTSLPYRAKMSLLSYIARVAKHLTAQRLDDEELRRRLAALLKPLMRIRADESDEALVHGAAHLLSSLLKPFMADPLVQQVPGPKDDSSTEISSLYEQLQNETKEPGKLLHIEMIHNVAAIDAVLGQRFPPPYPGR